jgi:hypothetical protein
MNANDIDPSYRDQDQDKIMQRNKHDSRKPTITLHHLNRLKKMRAAKDLENLMRGDFMEIIYGATGEEEAAGGGAI